MKINTKQVLRHVVLAVLAHRHPAALNVAQIHRRAAMEVDFKIELEEVSAALELLAGMTPPLVKKTPDDLGPENWWSATAAGVLREERLNAEG